MYEKLEDIILKNDYIRYLKHLNIDISEILNNIKNRLNDKTLFSIYENRSYSMLSTNNILENIIFEEVNKYLYKNYKDSVIFENFCRIDIKTIIAYQNSLIERPKILKPSETEEGYKTDLNQFDNFIQIARFENEMLLNDNGYGRKGQVIIFEGISIFGNKMPFTQYLPSFLIWHNDFYDHDYQFIVGFMTTFNSIEANNILWINNLLQQNLGLVIDGFNNGLQALNEKNEVILKFRQWKSKLIGNASSFVGQDSNIPKLEGCDLILREDYYKQLQKIIPNMQFYSKKKELNL